jgi:hypothetical protein
MGRGPANLFMYMGKNDLENAREAGDDTLLIRLVQSRSKTSEDLDFCSDADMLFTKVPSEMAMSLLPLSTMIQHNYSKSRRQVEQDRLTNEQLLDHVIQWYSTKRVPTLINRQEALERLLHEYDICDKRSVKLICSDDPRINNQISKFAGRIRGLSRA